MTAEQPQPSEFQLTRGTVFPLIGGRSTWSQEYLPPMIATILVGLSIFAVPFPGVHLNANDGLNSAWQIYLIVAAYLAFMMVYYIYRMCSRARPWWLVALVMAVTPVVMTGPVWHAWYYFFYSVIPGTAWEKSSNPLLVILGNFAGTGLCEESFKTIPLLILALAGVIWANAARHTTGDMSAHFARMRRRFTITEPLHGIVLGVASGTGFFLIETLAEYVPNIMKDDKYVGEKAFDGLALLLARGLPTLAEHAAWAGLVGYFIGLSVLRPRAAIFLLPLGWFSAAALHGAWDATDALVKQSLLNFGIELVIAILSYLLLGGALFKAREISPTLAAANGAVASPAASERPSDSDWDHD
jgi:RsiW-degrading membrane proteinase PrsW (M82 family)